MVPCNGLGSASDRQISAAWQMQASPDNLQLSVQAGHSPRCRSTCGSRLVLGLPLRLILGSDAIKEMQACPDNLHSTNAGWAQPQVQKYVREPACPRSPASSDPWIRCHKRNASLSRQPTTQLMQAGHSPRCRSTCRSSVSRFG